MRYRFRREIWVCSGFRIFFAVTNASQTEVMIVILYPMTSVHRSLLKRNVYTLSERRMHVTSPLLRIVGAGEGSTESLSRERNCRSGSERGTFTRRSHGNDRNARIPLSNASATMDEKNIRSLLQIAGRSAV